VKEKYLRNGRFAVAMALGALVTKGVYTTGQARLPNFLITDIILGRKELLEFTQAFIILK
jgi:hypothetical protein